MSSNIIVKFSPQLNNANMTTRQFNLDVRQSEPEVDIVAPSISDFVNIT